MPTLPFVELSARTKLVAFYTVRLRPNECGSEIGRKFHGEIVVTGFEWKYMRVIRFWPCTRSLRTWCHSKEVFDKMLERDLTSWNTMILGDYLKRQHLKILCHGIP
ncbi:pentatricopeptide repeat-containing protein At1g11290, chloroplastic-like isoform X2 [Tripterygium wilfordii]|uniref:pentatricopeptide repeat-containing protein At1g11290, chloroplastic-like isoform X2 n=1 Tax=Tripterygium wilfordii TaxID=458696 RepID=UPI0018F85F17|nr:pentatricopeptide repeat-containing protein At1g11290, chloroplastic-like isoform X2 [Tripterygium wilfordii]